MCKGFYRKAYFILPFLAVLAGLVSLAGCTTVNISKPLEGRYAIAGTATKGFVVIGIVSVNSTETHTISPFGIVRKVEGAKVTYGDLMEEAAKLDADNVIDVRIDMNTSGKTGFFDWVKGWERVFTYTGEALAVKYTNEEAQPAKAPEATVNTDSAFTWEESDPEGFYYEGFYYEGFTYEEVDVLDFEFSY